MLSEKKVQISDDRIPLEKGSELRLARGRGSASEVFTIGGCIGRSRSALWYDAEVTDKNGTKKRGRIKEIYPLVQEGCGSHYSRSSRNNRLTAGSGQLKAELQRWAANACAACQRLESIRSSSEQGSILNNFVPDFTLFDYSASGSTLYIWTAADKYGMTFKEFIDEQLDCSSPEQAAVSLKNIILTICTLAECVCSFHSNGLLLLDLNPGGVLLCKNNMNDINPNLISLLDMDSVFDIQNDSSDALITGTPGFSRPADGLSGSLSYANDIYSITAMLFYALSSDTEGRHYIVEFSKGFTMSLNKVKSFSLLDAAKSKLESGFLGTLMSIFKKGFSPAGAKDGCYESCEELLNELRFLNGRLPVDGGKGELAPDETISVKKKRELSDMYSKNIIQNLLYDIPLYHYSKTECAAPEECNVLVLGSGSYSCRFVDCCLQAGQMIFQRDGKDYESCRLTVTVVSQNAVSDMKNYVRYRPALASFFNVNGSLEGSSEESYGTLRYMNCGDVVPGKDRFSKVSDSRGSTANAELVEGIIRDNPGLQYVFIALGDCALNLEIARCVCGLVNRGDQPGTVVAFAWDSPDAPNGALPGMHNVYFPSRASKSLLHINDDLRRMAFNAHMVWYKSTKNYSVIEDGFNKPYNFSSSLSFALSVKYKLHCIGIDTAKAPDAVADDYNRKVNTSGDSRLFDALVQLEHRRWVVEKLTDKWIPPESKDGVPDLSFCLNGDTKDYAHHIHPCIARSSFKPPKTLGSLSPKQWDDPGLDLSELDELDRISVQIHRTYIRDRSERRENGSFFSPDQLSSVRAVVCSLDRTIIEQYEELIFCIQNVLDGNSRYAFLYSSMMKSFLELIEKAPGIPLDVKEKILVPLKAADKILFSLSSCLRYEDFKGKDADIIRYLPYIITFSRDLHLVVPLFLGSDISHDVVNNSVFKNVAAPVLLLPRKISYIYYLSDMNEFPRLEKAVSYIRNYLSARGISCALDFLIGYDSCLPDGIDAKLFTLSDGIDRLETVCFSCGSQREAIERICDSLLNDGTDKPDLFEENDSPLSLYTSVMLDLPSYRFDSSRGIFRSSDRCSFVKYITLSSKHALTANDMFMLKNSVGKKNDVPAYQRHYMNLWKTYKKDQDAWKWLCSNLSGYFSRHDCVAKFTLNEKAKRDREKVTKSILLPISQYQVADKIVKRMIGCEIFDKSSGLSYYDPSTVEAVITADPDDILNFHAAMAKLCCISDPELVSVERNYNNKQDTEYDIKLALLDVRDLNITIKDPNTYGRYKALLDTLSGNPNPKKPKKSKNTDNEESANTDKNESASTAENTTTELFRFIEPLPSQGFDNLVTQGENNNLVLNFRFNSYPIKEMFCTEGRILEVYAYYKLKECDYFDDIVSSGEVCWDQSDVTNELDCIVTKGLNSIFIECKAKKSLDQGMFNKLYTVVSKYGINPITIMIADSLYHHDNTGNNDILIKRAGLLDVIVISDSRQIENIGETIRDIIEKRISK